MATSYQKYGKSTGWASWQEKREAERTEEENIMRGAGASLVNPLGIPMLARTASKYIQKQQAQKAAEKAVMDQAYQKYADLEGVLPTYEQLSLDEKLANRAAEDPRFKQEQLASLSGVRQYVDQRGITDAERAQLSQVNTAMDERLRGQRESTMQSMAQRGMGGGGQELASLMAGQQGAAQRQSMAQQQVLADAAGRRQQALQQLGSMSTGMRQQEYGMAEADRGAKMNLAQFNKQQRQLAYENREGLTRNVAALRSGQYAGGQAERADKKATAAKAIGAIGTAAVGIAGAFSDIRVKENIKEIDIKSMMDNLTPYEYNYIGDRLSDRRISPMAQDLLKSELGSQFVFENGDGVLMVDYGKALGTMMAINANLHKRVSELEGKLNG